MPITKGMRRILSSTITFLAWHRRALGALVAASAALLLIHSLASPPPSTTAVVLTSSISAGQVLEAGDFALHPIPDDVLPADFVADAHDLVGVPAAVPLSAGTVLQPGLLGRAAAVGSNAALVPITVSDDSVRAALRPGDLVSLVTSGESGPQVVATKVRIVTLPASSSSSVLGATSTSGAVLVEVPAAAAATAAILGQAGQLSIVLGSI